MIFIKCHTFMDIMLVNIKLFLGFNVYKHHVIEV
jgi:hypothetical protein